jgi:hypothetical protein
VPWSVGLRLAQALLSSEPLPTQNAAPGDVLEVALPSPPSHAWVANSGGEVERVRAERGKLRIAVPNSAARGSTLLIVAGDAVARIVVR